MPVESPTVENAEIVSNSTRSRSRFEISMIAMVAAIDDGHGDEHDGDGLPVHRAREPLADAR